MAERFYAGLECRADGRMLVGPALRYGEVSASHRERFEPGAFALDDGKTRWLDVGHDRQIIIAHTDGGGLELNDTGDALEVRATLAEIPPADAAIEGIKLGLLRGFSIEFFAREETDVDGVRVIGKADLAGVGLVKNPSYRGSTAEMRDILTALGQPAPLWERTARWR